MKGTRNRSLRTHEFGSGMVLGQSLAQDAYNVLLLHISGLVQLATSYFKAIKREMYTSSLFLGFQEMLLVRDASILPDKQSDTGKIYMVRISAFLDLLQASVSDLGEWQLHP